MSVDHRHFHDGTTCHGWPTLKECLDQAIENQWIGKVLEMQNGDVKCYSMIVSSFEHHAKRGKYVALTKVVGVDIVLLGTIKEDRDVVEPFVQRTIQRVREKHPDVTADDVTIRIEVRDRGKPRLDRASHEVHRLLSDMDKEGIVI